MKKKYAGFVFVGIVIGAVIVYIVPGTAKMIASWGSNEIMAAFTLAGVIAAFLVPVIAASIEERKYKRREKEKMVRDDATERARAEREAAIEAARVEREIAKEMTVYRIDINITLLPKNFVRFSASIENVGDRVIQTNISNLYIDQGIEINMTNDRDTNTVLGSQFKFPFILEHKELSPDGRPDCVLCKKCFRQHIDTYPEEIVDKDIKGDSNLLRSHISLDHLSAKSVQYINPKEKFSEDVVVQFRNKGVYRVTLFVGCNGDADCECATKQFYIEKSLDELKAEEQEKQKQLQEIIDLLNKQGGLSQ